MRQIRISRFEVRIGPTALSTVALALALLAAPLPSDAQQRGKVYRIGYLGISTGGYETNPRHCPIKGDLYWQAWAEGLRERGYIQGQNLVIECRWTEGREERAPALAADLVTLKPDLLAVYGTAQVRAAKQATSAIPIVMVGVIDPVRRGLVASLAQPGGNVTGLTHTAGVEIMGKYLQLLKEAVPKVSRVARLSFSGSQPEPIFQRERDAAALALGVTLQSYEVRSPEELAVAFAAMTKAGADAVLIEPNPFWEAHRQRVVDLVAQSRLPAVYPWREFVQAGGLMSYDVNRSDVVRRLGGYVDKILKGANPGDLPVEQPTKFDLVINLKTAKALGLTIPQSLLDRAEEVIQ
jgi:putative ABC transport system substrate-binding protein